MQTEIYRVSEFPNPPSHQFVILAGFSKLSSIGVLEFPNSPSHQFVLFFTCKNQTLQIFVNILRGKNCFGKTRKRLEHVMGGRVVLDIQARTEAERLYIRYNTDANVVNSM